MPDDDWQLSSGTVEFRQAERDHVPGRYIRLQVPACDRCTQGVMDATNQHLLGTCGCDCHGPRCEVRQRDD